MRSAGLLGAWSLWWLAHSLVLGRVQWSALTGHSGSFEQGTPHFHTALGPTGYVAGPACGFYLEPVRMEAWATDGMLKNSLKFV